MTYDPKAKRPVADDPTDDPAPVDQLLGAVEPPAAKPAARPVTRSEPTRLPAPVPTRRTPKALVGAAIALAVLFVGWRRFRR